MKPYPCGSRGGTKTLSQNISLAILQKCQAQDVLIVGRDERKEGTHLFLVLHDLSGPLCVEEVRESRSSS